jgi:hypothetical protein
MNRPGFIYKPTRQELLGSDHADWRSYIRVFAPYLLDSGDVISIGDRYFLSMGAHATHEHLLMDRAASEPLTIERSYAATALVAYAIDSPVIPVHSEEQTEFAVANLGEFENEMKKAGLRRLSLHTDAMLQAVEAAAEMIELGFARPQRPMRYLREGARGTWPFLDWPRSSGSWRAMTAYSSAIQSVAWPARILNFWRAMEATTDKADRYTLFESLESQRVRPVWTKIYTHRKRSRSITGVKLVDSTRALRRRALGRRDELTRSHGATKSAFDWLFWERRGKAAHADRSSLDYDGLSSIAEQVKDASLLQYMARAAIEANWH